MSSPPWDYIAKLVCIGDSGCGKSSLTIRLCEGRFSPQHDVTIGVEFGSRIVPVGPPHSKPQSSTSAPEGGLPEPPRVSNTPQKHMKLSLWDTAGQETVRLPRHSLEPLKSNQNSKKSFKATDPLCFAI